MNATEFGRRLDAAVPGGVAWTARGEKRLWAVLPPERLLDAVRWARREVPGFRLATATGIDLRGEVGVFYHFVANGSPLVATFKVHGAKPDPRLPSVGTELPSAVWIEREIAEMLGVAFEGHPAPHRLLKADDFGDDEHPLRRDFVLPPPTGGAR